MEIHGPSNIGDKGWTYACTHNGRSVPLGFCKVDCEHATPSAAREHFRQYLVQSAHLDGYWPGKQHRCEACGEWTARFAVIETAGFYALCEKHFDHNTLDRVLQTSDSELDALIRSTHQETPLAEH